MPDMAAPFPPLQERQLLQHGFMPPRNANIYQPLDMRVRQAASIRDLGNDATARKMRVRINRIARRTIRAGVRFRRMLSYGGMGVTCLFEVKNAQGLYNKCVVKMARPDCEPELLSEKKIMQVGLTGNGRDTQRELTRISPTHRRSKGPLMLSRSRRHASYGACPMATARRP